MSTDIPEGTAIALRVRSSNDNATWSDWEDVFGGSMSTTPPGQYLQIEVTLRINAGELSPVLYDLTALPACAE